MDKDICVSDCTAHAVAVVNQAGQQRSFLFYKGFILSSRHSYKQPESDPNIRRLQPGNTHPGSGRAVSPLH